MSSAGTELSQIEEKLKQENEEARRRCVHTHSGVQAEVAGPDDQRGRSASGTCGQVFKVRFKKAGHVIAVEADVFIAMELMGRVEKLKKVGPHSRRILGEVTDDGIDPPDPTKPDYDIRADVWSLGISLVELATGQFPYKNCKTDFEVLTKVLQEDPPLLPLSMGFSLDIQSFVKDCLTKDHRKRPKYHQLL
ncbi:dual specificity mitogen-activated protein kinase kinase 7 isoform X1, partial [Lates japonicus]